MKLMQKIEVALRNHARRKLCREYARNVLRNKRIIAQLGLLNSRAEIEAAAARIEDEWPQSAALKPQAGVLRYDIGMKAAFGVVEDDCGVDGLPGQWNKPVREAA